MDVGLCMSILFLNEQLFHDPQQFLHEAVVDHRTAAIIEHRTVYKCYEQYREHLLVLSILFVSRSSLSRRSEWS